MVTKYIMGEQLSRAYWLHLDKDLSTSGNIVIIFIFIGTVLGSNWTCLYEYECHDPGHQIFVLKFLN